MSFSVLHRCVVSLLYCKHLFLFKRGDVTRSYALCILFYLCVCMWILLMSVCMSRLGNHVNIYIYIISPCVLCAQSTSCTVICIRVSEKILELP